MSKIITTQQTAKVWKLLQLIGVLVLCVGVVMYVGRSEAAMPTMLLGAALYAVGRFCAWWRHG